MLLSPELFSLSQLLTYQGQALYDRRTVHDYNIKPCTTLFLKRVSKEDKLEVTLSSCPNRPSPNIAGSDTAC